QRANLTPCNALSRALGKAMRRRSRAGGEVVKTRHRKVVTPKRHAAPKAVRHSGSSAADQEAKIARLTRERDEALEQQAATSQVLGVFQISPAQLKPVLAATRENATGLGGPNSGVLSRSEGDPFRCVALHTPPPL